jgi:hypothetical protein
MSDKPKPDDEHWFWKFLLLPGPPWETMRNPLYQRGIAVVAVALLAFMGIVALVKVFYGK